MVKLLDYITTMKTFNSNARALKFFYFVIVIGIRFGERLYQINLHWFINVSAFNLLKMALSWLHDKAWQIMSQPLVQVKHTALLDITLFYFIAFIIILDQYIMGYRVYRFPGHFLSCYEDGIWYNIGAQIDLSKPLLFLQSNFRCSSPIL